MLRGEPAHPLALNGRRPEACALVTTLSSCQPPDAARIRGFRPTGVPASRNCILVSDSLLTQFPVLLCLLIRVQFKPFSYVINILNRDLGHKPQIKGTAAAHANDTPFSSYCPGYLSTAEIQGV